MSSPESRQQLSRILKPTVTGSVSTELDQVISGIPWGDAFTLGSGVDAITGAVTGSAIKPPITLVERKNKTSFEHYSFIQSESDLNREIEASASGKYNIEGVTASTSASYLNKLQYSELSITLIARYQSQYDGYDEALSYELTDEAKKRIGDPAKFREAYGDYFVSGGRRTSLFTAVFTCQTSTTESMDQFKVSLGGESPKVFTVEGSGRFMQAAREHNVRVSADLFMEGYSGTAPTGTWTPDEIMKALAWFKEHEQGINLVTKLRHYSTIDPNYPRTVDVAPEVFVDLRQLYTTVWGVRAGYHSLPGFYQTRYKSEFVALDEGVVANQRILPRDADKRSNYRQQANRLLSEFNDVFARMDFYLKVKAIVGTEPGKNQEIAAGKGQQRWMFGYSTYTKSRAVVITMTEFHHYEKEGFWTDVREHTFEFGPNQNYLIVGWEVIANWGDWTAGSWWKTIDQIIRTNYVAVHIKGLAGRALDWNLKIYYVEAKDYQF